jgi:hypothetical protein
VKFLGNEAVTITGAPGETVVLNLKNFILRDNSSFTLQGTATTTFIVNVREKFSLSGNSHLDLAGLQWDQVLFNVVGTGHRVSLGGDSIFNGILMANDRTVRVRGGATVSGEIIANRLNLQNGAHVKKPKEKSKEKDDDDDRNTVVSNSLLRGRGAIK